MRPIEPKRRLRHAVARARSIRLLALLFLLWPTALAAAVEIGFWSREFGSTFPHAFVTLEGTVDATGEPVKSDIGFTVRHRVGPSVLLGSVQGRMVSHGADYIARSDRHFTLTLSDEEYRTVLAVVERWRALPQPSYNLNRRNCVHFVAEVAAALGLRADPIEGLMKKPRSFLERVERDNEGLIAERGAAPPAVAARPPR